MLEGKIRIRCGVDVSFLCQHRKVACSLRTQTSHPHIVRCCSHVRLFNVSTDLPAFGSRSSSYSYQVDLERSRIEHYALPSGSPMDARPFQLQLTLSRNKTAAISLSLKQCLWLEPGADRAPDLSPTLTAGTALPTVRIPYFTRVCSHNSTLVLRPTVCVARYAIVAGNASNSYQISPKSDGPRDLTSAVRATGRLRSLFGALIISTAVQAYHSGVAHGRSNHILLL